MSPLPSTDPFSSPVDTIILPLIIVGGIVLAILGANHYLAANASQNDSDRAIPLFSRYRQEAMVTPDWDIGQVEDVKELQINPDEGNTSYVKDLFSRESPEETFNPPSLASLPKAFLNSQMLDDQVERLIATPNLKTLADAHWTLSEHSQIEYDSFDEGNVKRKALGDITNSRKSSGWKATTKWNSSSRLFFVK
ncbi:hypothetical protein C8J56DRAFT_1166670 [Mycena floridula]|nr:hypothetical protein C8J56DRAFT_1166670 [Mycena floridula]